MRLTLDREHLDVFSDCVSGQPINDPKSTKIPREWAACTELGAKLPNTSVDRQDLLTLASDRRVDVEVVCWSILAWGGMHGAHRNSLARHENRKWLVLSQEIREGQLNRSQAYSKFSDLKNGSEIAGLGPAFFTKLIFFLMPRSAKDNPPGYIMDQWVGCSINLLYNCELVLMDRGLNWTDSEGERPRSVVFTVSPFNGKRRYEAYCQAIEEVGREINRPGDETEFFLMSKGGRNKDRWREYVYRNRAIEPRRVWQSKAS